MALSLSLATARWNYLALRVMIAAAKNKEAAGASSVDFLMYSGYTTMAYQWLRMADVAYTKLKTATTDADKDFYKAKIQTAQFYFDKILPRTQSLSATILAGPKTLMQMKEDHF